MNETLKTILTRRSVRSFQSRKIERPDLELILKAATYAPSGMNRQTWQFTAVTDRDEIRKLAKLIEVEMERMAVSSAERVTEDILSGRTVRLTKTPRGFVHSVLSSAMQPHSNRMAASINRYFFIVGKI